jgi:hypothetical protein
VAVSADLLKNEYNNQATPGNPTTAGFLVWGSEATPTGAGLAANPLAGGGAAAIPLRGFII